MKSIFFIFSLLLTLNVFSQNRNIKKTIKYIENQNYENARQTINKATLHKRTKNKSRTWFLKARVYTQFADYDTAYKAIYLSFEINENNIANADYLKIYSTIIENLAKQAKEYYSTEKYDSAFVVYKKITTRYTDLLPDKNKHYYNAALCAYKNNELTDAEELFFAIDSGYCKRFYFLSKIYSQKNDSVQAIEILQKGIITCNENDLLIKELTQNYLLNQPEKDAIAYIDKCLNEDPDNHLCYYAKGLVLQKHKNYKQALDQYFYILKKDTGFVNANFNIASIYYNEAIEIKKVAEKIPVSDVYNYEKTILKARKKMKQSLPYLQKFIEKTPDDLEALALLQNIYSDLQRYYEAKQIKERINELEKQTINF